MRKQINTILLADDDEDDCSLFKEALARVTSVQLTIVHDGESLMKLLNRIPVNVPDILFMDLNMPRKNGGECLTEIKQDSKLKEICIIIYSTSYLEHVADKLYEEGANYYIRKPSNFDQLKKVLEMTLLTVQESLIAPTLSRPARNKFRLA